MSVAKTSLTKPFRSTKQVNWIGEILVSVGYFQFLLFAFDGVIKTHQGILIDIQFA